VIKTQKHVSEENSLPHFILREYDALTMFKDQQGFSKLKAVYYDTKSCEQKQYPIKFVFEFYKHGDLFKYMKAHAPLTNSQVLDFMEQLLSALKTMHDHAYIHRDLKPANLLVGEQNGSPKLVIADLGLSRQINCPPDNMTKQI
jgi:serine/threonine protein kinase